MLYLGGNQIGDKGVKHFANVLQKNKVNGILSESQPVRMFFLHRDISISVVLKIKLEKKLKRNSLML